MIYSYTHLLSFFYRNTNLLTLQLSSRKNMGLIIVLVQLFWCSVAVAIDGSPSGVLRNVNNFSLENPNSSDKSLIVIIHGWNPGPLIATDCPFSYLPYPNMFETGEWPNLRSALSNRVKSNKWKVLAYDWSSDAATGPVIDCTLNKDGISNAVAAASNGLLNGNRLAEQINLFAKNLRQLTLIAHSAGAWVAYEAAHDLLMLNSYISIEIVLLDPFIPGQLVSSPGLTTELMGSIDNFENADRFYKLQNYFAKDTGTDYHMFTGEYHGATSQPFSWPNTPLNGLQIDFVTSIYGSVPDSFYKSHGGPIQFYANTIVASEDGAKYPYPLSFSSDIKEHGFFESLYHNSTHLDSLAIGLQLKNNTSLPVMTGGRLELEISAFNVDEYVWYKDGEPCVFGSSCYSNNSQLIIDPVVSGDAGEYVVKLSDNNGYFIFSDKVVVLVTSIPPPAITKVTPVTLVGMDLPLKQSITINGKEFNNQSKLKFFDGVNTFEDKTPTFDSSTQLRYNLAVGPNSATWTVRVVNDVESSPFEFYVDPLPLPPQQSIRPDASDGTYTDRARITWRTVSDATYYEVYRCTTIYQSSCITITTTGSVLFDDHNISNAKTYYYRIKACNSNGCASDYSLYDRGHRGSQVAPPTSGVNASDGLYTNGVIVYWPPVSGASYYQIQRATSLSGSKSTLSYDFTYTTYADTQAVPDRTYYYWVRSCNSSGVCGAYGDPDSGYRASETPILQPAINPTPENGDSNVSIKIGELNWDNGGGASTYDVYFGTDSAPGSGELLSSPLSTRKGLPDLDYNTTYYWRIDSKSNGQIITGPVWSFTTRNESAPDLPQRAINPTPKHYAENVSRTNSVLTWENGGGATGYDVYFGRDFQPGSEQFVGNTTMTSWALPTLDYDKIYYWRIKARNAGGTAHGDVWRFKVEPSAPDPAIFPGPDDGQVNVSTGWSRLYWTEPQDKSTSFDVYFGTNAIPGSSEFRENTTRNEWNLPVMEVNTTYYWQIISKNNAGSTSSPVWSFTTWPSTPGTLSINEGGFVTQGSQGGSFSPSNKVYTVANIGEAPINYTVSSSYNWLDISPANGTLAPQEEAEITISINSNANSLTSGIYNDALNFNNTTDNKGTDVRAVSLAIDEIIQPWDAKKLASGYKVNTFIIKANGGLVGWGTNTNSILGLGEGSPPINPAPVSIGQDLDWSDISTGDAHTLAVKNDGTMYAWGANESGQLGLGDEIQRNFPTQVGTDNDWLLVSAGIKHCFALKRDGRLFSFGLNNDGQLGLGDQINRDTPVQVGTDSDWRYVYVEKQLQYSFAIKEDGRMFFWGNKVGPDNSDQLIPLQFGTDTDWVKVVIGENGQHILALKTNGTLFAWGKNHKGQLGLGDFIDRELPTQIGIDQDWVDIAAGGTHTMALKKDGNLYTWGYNLFGQLGVGDILDRKSPELVMQDSSIVSISGASTSSFLLLDSGEVYGWGANFNGILGLGFSHFERVLFPRKINLNWAVVANAQPTIVFSSPVSAPVNSEQNVANFANTVSDNNGYIFSGTASDNDGYITEVQYRINSGEWETATGTNSWSFRASGLTLGENIIEVRSRDDDGLYSSLELRSFNLTSTDSDGDGIDDNWELLYFINLNVATIQTDFDDDGQSDLIEYLQNSNPTDNHSQSVNIQMPVAAGFQPFYYPLDDAFVDSGFSLLSQLDSLGMQVQKIQSFDTVNNLILSAEINGNSLVGQDFYLSNGQGVFIVSEVATTIPITGAVKCLKIDLAAGMNVVGFRCVPPNYSSFKMLTDLGDAISVSAIQRFNMNTARYETATYKDDQPAGNDFNILVGEAYLVHMLNDVLEFDPLP